MELNVPPGQGVACCFVMLAGSPAEAKLLLAKAGARPPQATPEKES